MESRVREAELLHQGIPVPITFDPSETPCMIRLSGEVNIRCAAELKEIFVEALSLERDLRVDLTGVTEVDITALQLLWLVEHDAQSAGRNLTFDRVMPDAIVAALNHAGLKFPMPSPMPMPMGAA